MDVLFLFQKRSKAQTLLDKVYDHLELIEKDYFGLQFLEVTPTPEGMVSISPLLRSYSIQNSPILFFSMLANYTLFCKSIKLFELHCNYLHFFFFKLLFHFWIKSKFYFKKFDSLVQLLFECLILTVQICTVFIHIPVYHNIALHFLKLTILLAEIY